MYFKNTLALAALPALASAAYTTEYLTGSSNNTIQVLVEGEGPSLLVWPSYARDSIEDFHEFSTALAEAGNYSNPVEERLAALELGYFAPGHNASVWLSGWFPEAVGSVSGTGVSTLGGNNTQILDLIAKLDPWRTEDQWNYTTGLAGARSTVVFVEDASHALFPENLQGLLDVLLPCQCVQVIGVRHASRTK
ncbi:hypothetical protein COL922a_012129 [Colletotrichum nupharicola]|nr:hypothetical protein COL922a_012129 [Colletotrichum nupharicola]